MKIPEYKFALTEEILNKTDQTDKELNAVQWLPTRAKLKDSGWDVRAAKEMMITPGEYVKIPLGFRALPPEGWWLDLRPRSSSFHKKHLHALYGVIDETYEGEVCFCCQWLPEEFSGPAFKLEFGDKIGQLIPVRRQEMKVVLIPNEEYDKETIKRGASRGTGGFGSTG